MKLLVDMNLSPRWIGLLHNAGCKRQLGAGLECGKDGDWGGDPAWN